MGRFSRRIAKLGWESLPLGAVGRYGETQLKFVEPIRRRLATRVAEFTAALLGERRGEGETVRLISSCPSYGAGRVNELASRQGPADPLSCRRSRENETADRASTRFAKRRSGRQSERNKWKRGGNHGEEQRERARERDKRKRIERGGNARAYVCVKESGRHF